MYFIWVGKVGMYDKAVEFQVTKLEGCMTIILIPSYYFWLIICLMIE